MLSAAWRCAERATIQGDRQPRADLMHQCQKARLQPAPDDCSVGLTGFEPATSSSQTKRATKLRHSPPIPCVAPTGPATRRAGFETKDSGH